MQNMYAHRLADSETVNDTPSTDTLTDGPRNSDESLNPDGTIALLLTQPLV